MKSKKINLFVGLCLPIFMLFFGCGSNSEDSANNKKAIEYIKSSFSEKIIEAYLTDANVVYVSVADNGVEQSRFAETLCNMLKEQKCTAQAVKVVKVNSTKDPNADNAYGVLLGEAYCN
jgi:hypothetical protein